MDLETTVPLYGCDWVAVVLTLAATYALGNRRRVGFVLMMLANLAWLGVALLVGSVAMVLANVVFFAMNLRGYWKWRHGETHAAPPSA